jgi:hypothetical protein
MEAMQAAQARHQLAAGPQVEVIGVSQHQRGAQFIQVARRHRLDRGLCADRRKDRGREVAVWRSQQARSRASGGGEYGKFKHDIL